MSKKYDQEADMNDYDLVGTKPFKLKDRPENRQRQVIDLSMFGVVPKRIIVEKVVGQHDTFVIRCFVPKRKIVKA